VIFQHLEQRLDVGFDFRFGLGRGFHLLRTLDRDMNPALNHRTGRRVY
jgi:hypothetical protein